jgi:hypothetical protein
MVQALFEDGVLQRNGVVKLVRPMKEVKVPASVQAVLAVSTVCRQWRRSCCRP